MKSPINPSRRKFLKQSAAVAGMAAGGSSIASLLTGCSSNDSIPPIPDSPFSIVEAVAIVKDPSAANSVQAAWATNYLIERFAKRHITAQLFPSRPAGTGLTITCVISNSGPSGGLSVKKATKEIILSGNDAIGLVYAILEVANVVDRAERPIDGALAMCESVQSPANRVRSVLRTFSSDVEDKPWYNENIFWNEYLTNLATNRFSRFNLAMGIGYDAPSGLKDTYFYFAYPFLLSVPGYDVKANPLPDEERDSNLAMLKYISDETVRRGLQFFLGIWTHAYQWERSPDANYTISGLTPDIHAAYSRDAITLLLKECPNISGITLRTHGESGVPEGNYDFWKTLYEGIASCGRKVEIDLHAKGLDDRMIQTAVDSGLPVTLAPKFWAEHCGLPYHQSSIRETEMPRATNARGPMSLSNGTRSFLRYGFGDLMRVDRKYSIIHRIWPGTQRLLEWGDPLYAAEYGKAFSFAGSDGFEMFDPNGFKGRKGSGIAGRRDGLPGEVPAHQSEWKRYENIYRLWGRMTYDPNLRIETKKDDRLAPASRILALVTTAHCPSASNANYWPEIYTNMSLVEPAEGGPYTDTPSPRVFGTVSSLDPEMFATCREYAQSLLSGKPLSKVSPLRVADQLTAWATQSQSDQGTSVDTQILAALGHFFADKFRACVCFEIFHATNHKPALDEALKVYRQARDTWSRLAEVGNVAYVRDITFGDTPQIRGNWSVRLAEINADLDSVVTANALSPVSYSDAQAAQALQTALSGPPAWRPQIEHAPEKSFQRGMPISIALKTTDSVQNGRLAFRKLNQAERFKYVDLTSSGDGVFSAEIPADITDSPFPVQYYFDVTNSDCRRAIFPGFKKDFTGAPYFIVAPNS